MEKGILIGISDKKEYIKFSFKKNKLFFPAFERFLFNSGIIIDDYIKNPPKLSNFIDRVYVHGNSEIDFDLFFGKENILLLLRADSREKLLEYKIHLLKYFEFKN